MNRRGKNNGPTCLEYVILAVIGVLVVVFLLRSVASSSPAIIFNQVNDNLDSDVELNGIDVSVQTPPDVYVNHPFTVTASISGSGPLTSLTANGGQDLGNPSANLQGESLADILRPPNTQSYSLCLIVDLHFDDDAAFDFTKYSTPDTEQKFTLVPDVTTAETAHWTVTPQDTLGSERVPHDARLRVWFDAETTCRVGTGSLLDDSFYLESVMSAKFTVVNQDFIQQWALIEHLQPVALVAVAAVTTAAVAWAAGVFAWMPTRPRARRKQGASENRAQRRAPPPGWLSVDVRRGVELLGIGVVLITLGPSTVVYYLGTDAMLGSYFGGMVVALVGIVLLAMGVRDIRLASSTLAPPPGSLPTSVQGEQQPVSQGLEPASPSVPATQGVSRRQVLTTAGAAVAGLATGSGVTWVLLSHTAGSTSAHSGSSYTPTAPRSPIPGTARWQFHTGGAVYSSPTVANGVVYVGSSDGTLYAVDTTSGTRNWQFRTNGGVYSPTVAHNIVYVYVSSLSPSALGGHLYALQATTSTPIWQFPTSGAVYSSPTVANGVVYVGATGAHEGSLYAVQAATGKQLWRFATDSSLQAAPAVANGVVYVGSNEGSVYAVEAATGKQLWRFQTSRTIVAAPPAGSGVVCLPAVANGVVYVGSVDYYLFALEAATGNQIWRFQTGGIVLSSPAVANGVVYVGSQDDSLYAVEAATGKQLWRFQTGNSIESSPAVANGVVYISSDDGSLYAVEA